MNPLALAGISLAGLAAVIGQRRGEGRVFRTTERGVSPRQRDEQRRGALKQTKLKLRHKHGFVVGGRRFVTSGTLTDPRNPRNHTHFLTVPVRVEGQRAGTKTRMFQRVLTTFDAFGPSHTHGATIRGTVFRSTGPF